MEIASIVSFDPDYAHAHPPFAKSSLATDISSTVTRELLRRLPVPDYQGASVSACHHRIWTRAAGLDLEIRSNRAIEAEIRTEFPMILFTVEAVGGEISVAPKHTRGASRPFGPLTVLQAGTAVSVRGKAKRFRQFLLQFDGATLSAQDDALDLAVAFQPRFMFSDAGLSRLCLLLADECHNPHPMGRLYSDSLTLSLLLTLSRARSSAAKSSGGLAPWQMRRLDDYADANLAEDISLDSLARMVGISRSHFGRAFKQTKGQCPFEWLRAKRVERAKELLLEGVLPVAEVAIATGFADQSHLTRAFCRLVGEPPASWRRARWDGLVPDDDGDSGRRMAC
ncbi:MAG: hypothetical protein JWO51_2115 [Rhodospirillales bacterium]|nr:hypothetical protein [Rhodospirillales bacterium]